MNEPVTSSSIIKSSCDAGLLIGSLPFCEWQAACEEVPKHKWFESERTGRDVGIDDMCQWDGASPRPAD